MFYLCSDVNRGAATVEHNITGSLLQLGNIVLMVASSLAVPIRDLLSGDTVENGLVCVLMLLGNSTIPRIDLSSVQDVNGMNAEVKTAFTKTVVSVEGANGYQAIDYRLRFDNKTKQEVLELVLYHDTMIEPTPRTVRKWLHKLGERRFSQFLDVRMADILAHAEGTQESRIERCIALGSIMSEVLEAEQCFALKDLQINGRDIMNLGIEQGKRVGEILNSLLDEVISGALENEHNALMQRAVEILG